jgi:hypothetical protein
MAKVKVVVPNHLKSGTETFADNILIWITRSITVANRAKPGVAVLGNLFGGAADTDTGLVEDWFGELNTVQHTTLKNNLGTMKAVLANSQTSVRIVDAPNIQGDTDYYAQVRGRYNPKMPKLSVEVADEWKTANLDTKVNTLFHELSHRILGTLDLGPQQGYTKVMYGVANAQSLAKNNLDDALRNAENYGYFIALCNGFTNQAS